ncbi:hypothetical protein SESBI_15970 [Sesbania bispinosa]|nr:hypothetical protein SESBI_15970 [Sesbania bispinosa]
MALKKFTLFQSNQASCSYNIALSAMILWAIWKQRNDKTFRDSLPSPTGTQKWAPTGSGPPQGLLKVNTDAAWNPDSKVGAISIVVRDHDGRLLAGHAKKISTYSPLAAEKLYLSEKQQ